MIKCYACQSENIIEWLSGFEHHYRLNGVDHLWHYRLMECGSCGLGFIDPMPSSELLETFYRSDYHCYKRAPGAPEEPERFKYLVAHLRYAGGTRRYMNIECLVKRCGALVIELLSGKTVSYSLGLPLQLATNAMVFELGYGTGQWLTKMAHLGYTNLYGYDIDANPVNTSKLSSVGINLSSGDFLKGRYPTQAYDCIRLEHVFEHLADPIPVLEKCKQMLKPHGYLVMTLPCKASLSRLVSSRHWGPLEPPVHIFHHTPQSLRLILEKAGFADIKIKPYAVIEQLAGTLQGAMEAGAIRKLPIHRLVWRTLAPPYKWISQLLHRGDFMTVCATPTSPL